MVVCEFLHIATKISNYEVQKEINYNQQFELCKQIKIANLQG